MWELLNAAFHVVETAARGRNATPGDNPKLPGWLRWPVYGCLVLLLLVAAFVGVSAWYVMRW